MCYLMKYSQQKTVTQMYHYEVLCSPHNFQKSYAPKMHLILNKFAMFTDPSGQSIPILLVETKFHYRLNNLHLLSWTFREDTNF